MGIADGQASKQEAEDAAIENCRSQGGQGCSVSLAYKNQCAAVAWGEATVITAGGPTIESASDLAMQKCRSKDKDCQIYYTNCVQAARIR